MSELKVSLSRLCAYASKGVARMRKDKLVSTTEFLSQIDWGSIWVRIPVWRFIKKVIPFLEDKFWLKLGMGIAVFGFPLGWIRNLYVEKCYMCT